MGVVRLLATAGEEGIVRIHDIQAQTLVGAVAAAHASGVNDLSWHPSSRYVFTGSSDGAVRGFDVNQISLAASEAAAAAEAASGVSKTERVPLAPDRPRTGGGASTQAAAAHPSSSPATRRDARVFEALGAHACAATAVRCCNTQAPRVFSGGYDEAVKQWDFRAQDSPIYELKAHESPVSSIDMALDDSVLLTSGLDKYVRLWDTDDGVIIKTVASKRAFAPVAHACFSDNYRYILSTAANVHKCSIYSIDELDTGRGAALALNHSGACARK
eukprot:GHVU01025307.1.p1 GENE.GHVU01025307.1~~GHVU01025307.1.p1  ORF type:complete len:273 (-),score=50.83 GHVU01025307.1:31-849(-)